MKQHVDNDDQDDHRQSEHHDHQAQLLVWEVKQPEPVGGPSQEHQGNPHDNLADK
ncbi:hypothetical protein [Pseudomonas nicosulfuronedens]